MQSPIHCRTNERVAPDARRPRKWYRQPALIAADSSTDRDDRSVSIAPTDVNRTNTYSTAQLIRLVLAIYAAIMYRVARWAFNSDVNKDWAPKAKDSRCKDQCQKTKLIMITKFICKVNTWHDIFYDGKTVYLVYISSTTQAFNGRLKTAKDYHHWHWLIRLRHYLGCPQSRRLWRHLRQPTIQQIWLLQEWSTLWSEFKRQVQRRERIQQLR